MFVRVNVSYMGRLVRGLVLAVAILGCTKANPAAMCTGNGTCIDPDFPFCDMDGTVGGTPGACIAVSCTANMFGMCSGSDALVCDATGTTYDRLPCINGCAADDGCITCTANTHNCTNGVATICDDAGALSTQTCALGCSSAEPTRCTRVVPSNGLATYFDLADPDDLVLPLGTIDLDASTFDDGAGNVITLPSFDVAAPNQGAPIRVLVARHLSLGDVVITSATAESNFGVGRAVAFLATGDIDVTGRVLVRSGAVSIIGCDGAAGTTATLYTAGSGGGAFGSVGAKGGIAPGGAQRGLGGSSSGNVEIVPLRGGCLGGDNADFAGPGGGAIQLVSLTAINLSGTIVVDGSGGSRGIGAHSSGGGAGGGILLEAPAVKLSSGGKLLARGGGGKAGGGDPPLRGEAPPPPDDANPPPGGVCSAGTSSFCGDGGSGAGAGVGPTDGASTTDVGVQNVAGGGGGGLGRIRVNTVDGMFTPANGSIVAGVLTVGTIGTL